MDEKSFFANQCPKKYQQAQLDLCDKQPASFIEFGKKWAKKPVSLFLFGGYGSGKTNYAFALIREMFRSCPVNIWPRYFTSTDLDSRLLKASMSEFGDRDEIDYRKKEDLLFIDDLGREIKSDRLRRQYFEILNYRYSEELPTILTSNFSLDKLGDIIDGSISSRIQEWQSIEFKGPDLRK